MEQAEGSLGACRLLRQALSHSHATPRRGSPLDSGETWTRISRLRVPRFSNLPSPGGGDGTLTTEEMAADILAHLSQRDGRAPGAMIMNASALLERGLESQAILQLLPVLESEQDALRLYQQEANHERALLRQGGSTVNYTMSDRQAVDGR